MSDTPHIDRDQQVEPTDPELISDALKIAAALMSLDPKQRSQLLDLALKLQQQQTK